MSTSPFSVKTTDFFRAAILIIAPAVMVIAHSYHPWIGSPGDPEFFAALGAAVAANPTRWAVAHLGVAIGSGLLILAFFALRGFLSDAGENRWSPLALPFIIMGSVLYALLPAMEFAPVAALEAGADPAAIGEGLMPWFVPILLTGAAIFALGTLGFVIGLVRSRALATRVTWLVAAALVLLALTRFLPVGAAQLYVGPVAALVALWPLAYTIWKRAVLTAEVPAEVSEEPMGGTFQEA